MSDQTLDKPQSSMQYLTSSLFIMVNEGRDVQKM
jgi:hypothetical protein